MYKTKIKFFYKKFIGDVLKTKQIYNWGWR